MVSQQLELELRETDYATVSDITIAAGATAGTTAFNPTDDSIYEGNETGIIAIDTVSGVKLTDRLPQLIVEEKHETETRKNGRFLPLCGACRDHHIGGIFGQFDQHGDGARSLLVDLRAGCVHE